MAHRIDSTCPALVTGMQEALSEQPTPVAACMRPGPAAARMPGWHAGLHNCALLGHHACTRQGLHMPAPWPACDSRPARAQGSLKGEVASSRSRAQEARTARDEASRRHTAAEAAARQLREQIASSKVCTHGCACTAAVPSGWIPCGALTSPTPPSPSASCVTPSGNLRLLRCLYAATSHSRVAQGQKAKARLQVASKEASVSLDAILASCRRGKLAPERARQQVCPCPPASAQGFRVQASGAGSAAAGRLQGGVRHPGVLQARQAGARGRTAAGVPLPSSTCTGFRVQASGSGLAAAGRLQGGVRHPGVLQARQAGARACAAAGVPLPSGGCAGPGWCPGRLA